MVLAVGERAPDFSLLDTELRRVTLSDLLSSGRPVVLVFFPAAFSSVCTRELCTFRDRMAMLERANAVVAGISRDSPFCLREFRERHRIPFPLLSDYNGEAVRAYDVVLDDLAGMKGMAKRAVYIIGPTGRIEWVWWSDDPRVEPDYDTVIRATGEVAARYGVGG